MAAIQNLLAESPEALPVSQLKAGLRKGHDLPVQELEAVLPGKVGMECGIASPRFTVGAHAAPKLTPSVMT